jgi:ATP-dependent Clp protease, protease subunit
MYVPYRLPGSNYVQWVDLYTRLAYERIIFLDQAIDDSLANNVIALMLYLDSDDPSKPIFLYINSPGDMRAGTGMSMAASMSIYDTMQHIKSPVHTICLGQAGGTAAMLLAAGTKGSRTSLPNAEIVLTPLYLRTRGQATDLQIDTQKVLGDRTAMLNILAQSTGQTPEKIAKDMDRRFYLTAQEAQEYGLIDRVLDNATQLPKAVTAAL